MLKHRDTYTHKETGDLYTLNKDYNGTWFLSAVDKRAKTLSVPAYEMLEALKKHYVKE